jgi:hypothetical protein
MTQLGNFRDDFYNPVNVLTNSQVNSTSQASGVLAASSIASAVENYVVSSGATALTTDSAANIIANLQTCLISQLKAQLANGSAGSPPAGVPSLNNLTFYMQIANTNASTLTISAGAGVTLTGAATIATASTRGWSITVTGPNTVTMTTTGTQSGFTV